jgi:hypothetical protein
MKPIEMFTVIAKTFGLILIVVALSQIPYAAAVHEPFERQYGAEKAFMVSYAGHIVYVVIGFLLLFKGEWLANLAYSSGESPTDDDADDVPPKKTAG